MFDCIIYLLGVILVLAALEALIIVGLLIKNWRNEYPDLKNEHDIHMQQVTGRIMKTKNDS